MKTITDYWAESRRWFIQSERCDFERKVWKLRIRKQPSPVEAYDWDVQVTFEDSMRPLILLEKYSFLTRTHPKGSWKVETCYQAKPDREDKRSIKEQVSLCFFRSLAFEFLDDWERKRQIARTVPEVETVQ